MVMIERGNKRPNVVFCTCGSVLAGVSFCQFTRDVLVGEVVLHFGCVRLFSENRGPECKRDNCGLV